LALFALWVLMHIPALFSHQPWHFDELRYLEVARQLGEYGNWLVPHINGEVYQEKPPFFFWCVVLVQRVVGDYLIAGHLTVALALLGTALLITHLGNLLFGDRRIGAFGGGLFLTFFFIHDIGTRVLLDPFFTGLTTAAVVALLHAAISENWPQRLRWTALAAAATSAACMTKGPVGIAVILIAAAALGVVWRGRKGISITAMLAAAAIAGAMTLLWVYLAALEVGWWYWERMVFRQTVGRAVESWAHQKPWWMYLANLPRMLLPWLVILPAATWGAWRARRSHGGRAGLALGGAFVAGMLFFSFLSGKRMGYLAPLVPFAALFIAWGMSRTFLIPDGRVRTALVRAPQWFLTVLPFIGAAGALALAAAPFLAPESLGGAAGIVVSGLTPAAAPVAVVFAVVVAGAGAWIVRWREPNTRSLAAALVAIAICAVLAHAKVYPALDREYTAEPIAAYLKAHKAPDERLIMLNDHKDGRVNYYLNARHHEVFRAKELDELADQPGRLWVVALKRQWDDDLKKHQKARFQKVFEHKWAGTATAIYAERVD
jgi:4-amino-4-deoxy-L-arabinose transferase-like glycosyltransferase